MLRNPLLSDVLSLQNTLDRALGGPFETLWSRSGGGGTAAVQAIPFDVYATDDHAVVLAAVPGMRPDDLEITVHQNTVNLSGTVSNVADADETKNATWYVHELGSGSYRRSITLPFQIDAEQVQASFENGIVRVVLPKAEQSKPRRIAIRASQGSQPEAIGSGTTDQS